MPHPRTVSLLVACAASALLRAGPLAAQSILGDDETPRVNRVAIRGVRGVPMGDLRRGLATQPTRCRSIFLRPFCWVTRASIFVEKHDLEPAELPRDELRIRVFLWRRGWRHSTVATRVTPRGNGVDVTFDVNQGPATRVRSVNVSQATPVLGARQVRDAALPDTGAPLNVLQLDSASARLLTALWDRGYGDATVRDTALVADTLATVEVSLDPGRRTTIERIEVEGNERVTDRTVRDAMPIKPGQLYRRARVEESQRALYLTGMFQQALVGVPPTPDTAKTVVVRIEEAPFRLLRTQVGFTTFDYFQTQAQFTHYNWLGRGRRLDLTGVLGRLLASQLEGVFPFREGEESSTLPGMDEDAFLRPTWQASAQVTQPAFPGAGSSLALGVFARRRVEPSVVVDRGFGGNIAFTRNLADRAPLSLVYRYEMNTVLAGDVYFCINYGVCDRPTIQALQGRQSLSPLAVTGFVERVDDALMRNSGYSARLSLEHASGLTASDFRYNRAEAEFARDFRLGRGTLAGRVNAGWVRGLSGTGEAVGVEGAEAILHPTTRFYAGGARSVRGFAENQLGPRILTVDPRALTGEDDDSESTAECTVASLAGGECDPNPVPSSEFQPRPVGGTRLLAASVEYRRPVWGNFVGAVFVDAARVSDPAISALAEARTAITPGFGVRYRSPVGPIRVDLGIRPGTDEELTVITQVTEGGVNRLVRLNTPKLYDPLEDGDSGFLRRLGSRLALHLSIGEAF